MLMRAEFVENAINPMLNSGKENFWKPHALMLLVGNYYLEKKEKN